MLLTFGKDVATPLRKGAGSATRTPVLLVPSSSKASRHETPEWSQLSINGGSFSTAELHSTLIVDTPASAERGFFEASFDGNCESARKNLFVVSPDQSQEGLDLFHGGDGHLQSSSLDTSEGSIQTDTKDIASLILKAEQKLSVIRLSLEKALCTAESIRALTSGTRNGEEKSEIHAGEPPIPRPRRGLPMPHSIEEERNLRLVADLVLTPGKTLILSP